MLMTFGCASYFLIAYLAATHHYANMYYAAILVTALLIMSYLLCALANPGIASAKKPPIDEGDPYICEVHLHFRTNRLAQQQCKRKVPNTVKSAMYALRDLIIIAPGRASALENVISCTSIASSPCCPFT
jgi:hypothetical protein